jgi:GT2 family glycosyltransferase
MKVNVVIPCRNEGPYIAECIDAIFNCDLPDNCELLVHVVDGMSDDDTRHIVHELKNTYGSLLLIDNEKQLTPFAFNLGIFAGGKTDFVQIVGARHILSKNYIIENIEQLQKDSDTWCSGGRIVNEFINDNGEIFSKAMATSFGMGIGNFRTLSKSGFTDTVTSPMYRYDVFETIGYFDEELIRNQDDDFNFRISKEGGKIYYNHEISLKDYVRGNFKGLWRQFFQYGYWKVYVNKKHKAVTTPRQLIPPMFVAYLILFPLGFLLNVYVGLILLIPIAIYDLLAMYFSFRDAKSIRMAFKLLLTYPILHIGYGLGYWKGIFHFLLLGRKPSENQKKLSR